MMVAVNDEHEDKSIRTSTWSWQWRAVPGRGWTSTYTAWQGFVLIGIGLLMAVFQQWLVAALGIAVGILGLLYARRKYPEWQARQARRSR